jgi:deoxyribodipyrimidine photo-lyase
MSPDAATAVPAPTRRAVVWFKRDLRMQDHAALAAAQGFDEVLAVFAIEPEWLSSPECDVQHVAFALQCLSPLRAELAQHGLALQVHVGPALQMLQALHQRFAFDHLLSHEETGTGWSYTRDRAVAVWCRAHGVLWREFTQTGVQRRLKTRQGWAGRWQQRMDAPVLRLDGGFRGPAGALVDLTDLPTLPQLGLPAHHRPLPAAGEAAAHATLHSFLHERGRDYRRALSSPLTAEQGCSRLSAHLAYGTVSMRQVHQATEARIAQCGDRAWAYALRGFAGRLRWHCHFMQKLEDEPAIEFRAFSHSADGLRADAADAPLPEADAVKLQAWCDGRTGFPMVDACMRSLNATGWLNFRMRAMLVSFAAYHLWLHWRAPGLHLARQFLDFEPGIHWSQMQMQSGTTGINTLRIYSPAKQALEHDAKGLFVRRWVPEFGSDAYPAPIVDERAALAFAKEQLYGLRATPAARAEAQRVQQRHGSRKAGLPPSGPRTKKAATGRQRAVPEGQGELF